MSRTFNHIWDLSSKRTDYRRDRTNNPKRKYQQEYDEITIKNKTRELIEEIIHGSYKTERFLEKIYYYVLRIAELLERGTSQTEILDTINRWLIGESN